MPDGNQEITVSRQAAELIGEPESEHPRKGRSAPLPRWARWKFEAVRGLLVLVARLFSLNGLYLLGRAFGTCEYVLGGRRRRAFRRRLREIFGPQISEREIRAHTRNQFCRIRCDKIFYMVFDRLPREEIVRRVTFEGREYLDKAAAGGKGMYLLFSHHGSHHVGACIFVLLGYKVAGVRDPNESALRRYVQETYERSFPEFKDVRIFRADAFPRDLYRCFRENRLLGTALDVERIRSSNQKTIRLPMFGTERELLTGTVHIALRSAAPIMTGFMVCLPYYRFHFQISAPLVDSDTAKDDPDTVRQIMVEYVRRIEEYVRAHPDHISRTK